MLFCFASHTCAYIVFIATQTKGVGNGNSQKKIHTERKEERRKTKDKGQVHSLDDDDIPLVDHTRIAAPRALHELDLAG